jgi:uncharacterized membrane protein
MDLRDSNALRFFTVLVAAGTTGWIVNAVTNGSLLNWLVAAIWVVLVTLLVRRVVGRQARDKRKVSGSAAP